MRQLARNVLSTYAARGIALLSLLFLFPFIAGHVGLERYGIWLLVSSFTVLFTADFGIGTSAARYVAEAVAHDDWGLGSRTLSTGLAVLAGAGLVAAALFGGVMALAWPAIGIPDADRDLAVTVTVLAATGYLLLGLPLSLFRNALAGLQRYDVANGVLIAQSVLRVGLTVAALLSGAGIVAVVLVDVGVTVAGGLAALAACRRLAPALSIRPRHVDLGLAREVAPYSLQVFAIGAAALVILQADSFIVGLFLPVAAVSLYAAAFRIYQLCREVTGSLTIPLVPDASRAGAVGDLDRLRRLVLRGTCLANGLLCAVAVPVALLASPLLVLWAGPEFASAATATQILIAGLVVNNLHLIALPVMLGLGAAGRFAALHVTWAVSNVALSVALIGPFELAGVALGTTLPLLVLEPLYVSIALRRLTIPVRAFARHALLRGLGPAAAPGLALAAAVHVAGPQGAAGVAAAVAAWGAVYVPLFFALGLTRAERARLQAAVRRWGRGRRGDRAAELTSAE